MKKNLIIACAPVKYVDDYISKNKNNYLIEILSNNNRYNYFKEKKIKVYNFGKIINIFNISLFFAFYKSKPDIVTIITGEFYNHDNVYKTIIFINKFYFKNPFSILIYRGNLEKYEDKMVLRKYFYPIHLSILGFLLSILIFLISLNSLKRLLIFVLIIFFLEKLLKSLEKYFVKDKVKKYYKSIIKKSFKKEIYYNNLITVFNKKLGIVLEKNINTEVQIKASEINKEIIFSFATDKEAKRVTSYIEPDLNKENIMLLGCSIVFGWGLNDCDTFAWKLQERFKDFNILNYGVLGYSAYQMLLVLKDNIKKINPKLVIVCIGHLHEKRNTNSYERVIELFGQQFPYAVSINKKLNEYNPMGYIGFPFSEKSLIIDYFETIYNKLVCYKRDNEKNIQETFKHILFEIKKCCKDNNTKLLVISLSENFYLHDFLIKNEFNWNKCYYPEPEYSFGDIDGHPNKLAQEYYAKDISMYINKIFNNEKIIPKNIHISYENEKKSYIYPLA